MSRLSSHLASHHPFERDSHNTVEFSARKSCFTKYFEISDEPGGARTHIDPDLYWFLTGHFFKAQW
jgi:hypothetical protein